MANVGDKKLLRVTKDADGKSIVEGAEGLYRDYTEKEIEDLSEEVSGQKVIIWTVAEVNKEGEVTRYSAPIAYKRSTCELS